jgi:RNA polymerase sigma-70 factor (ECF subfamily)
MQTAERTERDRVLVRSFLEDRSETAFRELYRVHAPAVYAFTVRYLGGNRREADDAFQEAWLRAAVKLNTFRGDASLRTWLIGIALNCAREAVRRAGRGPEAPMDEPALAVTAPARGRIDRFDLERAIAGLPEGTRAVLLLHDVEGYTHDEIGRLLSIPPGTCKSRLSRARGALRARLTQGDPAS